MGSRPGWCAPVAWSSAVGLGILRVGPVWSPCGFPVFLWCLAAVAGSLEIGAKRKVEGFDGFLDLRLGWHFVCVSAGFLAFIAGWLLFAVFILDWLFLLVPGRPF